MTAPSGMDERIARRRAEVRTANRRRRLRRTLTVLTVLVVAVAAWVVDRSSVVALQDVRVTGLERVQEGQVLAAAGLPVGASTLRLPLAAARQRIEALPAVLSAEVRRDEPVVLEVRVVERTPLVRLRGRNGTGLVDADGVVFGPVCGECGDDALVEVVLEDAVPTAGTAVRPRTALGNAVAALRGLGPELVAQVEAVQAPRDLDALSFVLADGTVVQVGRADRLDEKERALAAVRAELGDRRVAVIDVRAPLAPVARD